MMLNNFAGDIPFISKALNGLDSALLSNFTIAPTIQSALYYLKNAMLQETFVDSTTTYHSEQYILEEAALNYSLQQLTNTLADVQMKLSALKHSIAKTTVVIPDRLSNSKEILTALHLAVSRPQINWSLGNKALRCFASLAIDTNQSIQQRQLLARDVWKSEYFMTDIVKFLKSGNLQSSMSLKALNKVIGQYKEELSCPHGLFNTLINLLLELKSPATAEKERLLVLWITKYQSNQIDDDSITLINSFLYSHKETVIIASSILEIFDTLKCSNTNQQLFFTATNMSAALMTTITGFKSNRNICYHGCKIIHNLTVLNINKIERKKLLDAGIFEVLHKVQESHISDQPIDNLICDIIRHDMSTRLLSIPIDYHTYVFHLIILLPHLHVLYFSLSSSGTEILPPYSNVFAFDEDIVSKHILLSILITLPAMRSFLMLLQYFDHFSSSSLGIQFTETCSIAICSHIIFFGLTFMIHCTMFMFKDCTTVSDQSEFNCGLGHSEALFVFSIIQILLYLLSLHTYSECRSKLSCIID